MRHLAIVEQTATGCSADSPDLRGSVSAGRTREETGASMREAIELHVEGLRAEGLEVPPPQTSSAYVDVAA